MTLRVAEHIFDGSTSALDTADLSSGYDSTKTSLGPRIVQNNDVNKLDNWAGPIPMAFARPYELSTAYAQAYPYVIDINDTKSWVFTAELTSAGATRRIAAYEYDKTTYELKWSGFITLTYPTTTNHTIRGLAVARHLSTTGTVSVSGTSVTGSSTTWTTNRYAVGARIGFGSTNPDSISTWYTISAISSNTSITLSGSAGTINSGTSFVIEELRVYTSTTNATSTNGGLFVAKGINYGDFQTGGTTIAAATTTDNIKAVYWLPDATTLRNTVACGLALDTTRSDTSHFVWILDQNAATTARIYKYNVRDSLTSLSSGKSTAAFEFRTGQQTTTGNIATTGQNGIIATSNNSAVVAGGKAMYFVTSYRIYRCVESGILSNVTNFLTDSSPSSGSTEVPPGGTDTFAATSTLTQVLYDSFADKFIVLNLSNAQKYATDYGTSSFYYGFLFKTSQLDSSLADTGKPPIPHIDGNQFSGWSENGMYYALKTGNSVTTSQLYVWPLGADWSFLDPTHGTSYPVSFLITPELSTTGCVKFMRVIANHQNYIGDSNLGLQNEPFRVYYRTGSELSGLGDLPSNFTGWTEVINGDLTSVPAANSIQFFISFRCAGRTCLTAKIYSLVVIYEDDSTDSHYQPSMKHSNVTNKIFAWRFSKKFGQTVPTLVVRIFDDVTDSSIAGDTTSSPTAGTFEKSTDDGNSWSAYNTTDKQNDITYIRYTMNITMSGVKARAVLQQYGSQQTGNQSYPSGSNVRDITFGANNAGDDVGMIVETDVGSANALSDVVVSGNDNQELVNELKQPPVPINNRRKVR